MDDLMEMATAFQSLFGAFRKRGEVVEKLLRAQSTNFVIVTGPDPLRVDEADDYVKALRKLNVQPDLWIVNKVHETPLTRVVFEEQEIHKWLSAANSLDDGIPDKKTQTLCHELNRAAALAYDLKARDDIGLQTINALLGKGSLIKIEAFTEEVEDGQAVEQFISALREHS